MTSYLAIPIHEARLPICRLRPLMLIAPLIAALWFGDTRWAAKTLPHEMMMWSGYVLAIGGSFIHIYSSLFLSGGGLATDGPYSVMRHPLYAGLLATLTGIGLQTASLGLTALMVAIAALCCLCHASQEESALLRIHGARFREYQQRVPAWLPRFTLWNEPQEIMAKPRAVLNAMLLNFALLMLFPVIEVLHLLHESGILPSFFSYP